MFWILLTDPEASQRKISFWGNQATNYFQNLKQGEIYKISSIKISEPKAKYAYFGPIEFLTTPISKFEKIENPPKFNLPQNWNFIENIGKIPSKANGELIDVAGIIAEVQDVKELSVLSGTKITQVRTFSLLDDSGKIQVSIWGQAANQKLIKGQIIAIKRALVGAYGGKSLTVKGFIELKPLNQKIDELLKFKRSQSTILASLFKETHNITDENLKISTRDWQTAPTKNILQMKKAKDAYYFTNRLPIECTFKVLAQIRKIANNMFYIKDGKTNWCLRITLGEEGENDDVSVQVIAFAKQAEIIMDGLTAEKASDMQHKQFDQFVSIIDDITTSPVNYIFGINIKENTWNDNKRMDFIIETVEKVVD